MNRCVWGGGVQGVGKRWWGSMGGWVGDGGPGVDG